MRLKSIPGSTKLLMVDVLLVLMGIVLIGCLSIEGRRPWIVFGFALLASLVFVRIGAQWAICGTGYWPHGITGAILAVLVVLVLPVVILTLFRAYPAFMRDLPQFWFPVPPLRTP